MCWDDYDGGARYEIKRQNPPRSERVVSPQAVSESASAAIRPVEAVAAPVVSADFLAVSAFPAVPSPTCGELSLAPVRGGFLTQERPQRGILRAGAGSVEKLLDVRIRCAPAGSEIWPMSDEGAP